MVEVNALADEFNVALPKELAYTYGNKGTVIVLARPSNQLNIQYQTIPLNANTSASFSSYLYSSNSL
ncbi:2822_t:CDS:1, partial [Rhizophagus irregularis]